MNHLTRTAALAATCLLAGGIAAGAASPAFAATGTPITPASSLSAIQAAAAVATNARITAINTAITKVTANTYLTSPDRATILARLNADLAGMNSEKATIDADTTAKQAATDYHTIFTNYRVFAVMIPQAHDAAGADDLTGNALPKLQSAHDTLATQLATSPKSTPALQADLADMQTNISAATAATNGLAAAALAVTPAEFNANKTVMTSLRAQLTAAIADAKKASSDGRSILAALK